MHKNLETLQDPNVQIYSAFAEIRFEEIENVLSRGQVIGGGYLIETKI